MSRPFVFGDQSTPALLDDFNRGDSTSLGGSWVEGVVDCNSTLSVVSNRVEKEAGGGSADAGAAWTAVKGDDLSAEVTAAGSVNASAGLLFKTVASDLYGYLVYVAFPAANFRVWRKTASWTDLGTTAIPGSPTPAAGDRLGVRIYMKGTSTVFGRCYRTSAGSWVQAADLVDATPGVAAGPWMPGLFMTSTPGNVAVDDFRANLTWTPQPYARGKAKKKVLSGSVLPR